MFYDKEKNINKIETLVGDNCHVIGNFSGTGIIKIDGIIDGDILWQDDVIVGPDSEINGNILCNNAFVNGTVNGNIKCKNILTIQNQGKVKGDIIVKKLVINESGLLDGKCTMLNLDETQESSSN
ncbi:polymer-forming cytoskeletal protein [Clostridium sp.]|uniref:bactofilin family protein n=1 Tax=Clostridium sp. TaxID=1506 RepID=UPI002FCC5CD6